MFSGTVHDPFQLAAVGIMPLLHGRILLQAAHIRFIEQTLAHRKSRPVLPGTSCHVRILGNPDRMRLIRDHAEILRLSGFRILDGFHEFNDKRQICFALNIRKHFLQKLHDRTGSLQLRAAVQKRTFLHDRISSFQDLFRAVRLLQQLQFFLNRSEICHNLLLLVCVVRSVFRKGTVLQSFCNATGCFRICHGLSQEWIKRIRTERRERINPEHLQERRNIFLPCKAGSRRKDLRNMKFRIFLHS